MNAWLTRWSAWTPKVATAEAWEAWAPAPWPLGNAGAPDVRFLPGPLRRAGFEVQEVTPHVRCGGPGSDVFGWLDAFFPRFVRTYAERGLMTAEEAASFDAEWAALRWQRDEGLSLGNRLCLALGSRIGAPVLTADTSWGEGDGIRQIR